MEGGSRSEFEMILIDCIEICSRNWETLCLSGEKLIGKSYFLFDNRVVELNLHSFLEMDNQIYQNYENLDLNLELLSKFQEDNLKT
jgi:hypothetical protein